MSRITRLLALMALGGVAVIAAGQPASAKAFSLDEVKILGPGLDDPLRLKGRTLSLPPYPTLATTFLPSADTPTIPPPHGAMGPRYEVNVQLRLHLFRRPRTVAVRRYLYPYAAEGPVMLTPAGQRFRMAPRGFGRGVTLIEPGWRLTSDLLIERLQHLGLPPAPQPSGRADVSSDVRAESLPWIAVAGSLAVGAALLLVRRTALRGHASGRTSF
jgi:hypothetical protein